MAARTREVGQGGGAELKLTYWRVVAWLFGPVGAGCEWVLRRLAVSAFRRAASHGRTAEIALKAGIDAMEGLPRRRPDRFDQWLEGSITSALGLAADAECLAIEANLPAKEHDS